jgi:anhydro-N-acetylmuramic acid kinase
VDPLFIGLMSGTSLDGVDGVLADLSGHTPRVLGHATRPLPALLRAELMALNTPGGVNELHRAALAGNAMVRVYAEVVATLLADTGRSARDVAAIGAHGQTVRHQPGLHDGTGYTLQLNQPALLAEVTGIAVVADFRSRDIAAGGQGAPLVPAFHHALFAQPARTVAVLNLGGIANISVLAADGAVTGFDCGPANALMDHWCLQHTGQPFDRNGTWAAQGRVLPALLRMLLAEPFLDQPPPKSTGRDLFHPAWLASKLVAADAVAAAAADVQSTLAEFTAEAAARHVLRHAVGATRLLVCGGGALNTHLMSRLAALLPGIAVASTDTAGLPPLQVEACAFAWLAQRTLTGQPGNLPAATGARGPRVLGAIYPA